MSGHLIAVSSSTERPRINLSPSISFIDRICISHLIAGTRTDKVWEQPSICEADHQKFTYISIAINLSHHTAQITPWPIYHPAQYPIGPYAHCLRFLTPQLEKFGRKHHSTQLTMHNFHTESAANESSCPLGMINP
mmetsp:Transcript_42904/g.90098  ORF Transcript_42904/g.90098 Transcript_42904/m.90098 type:complete len:136 (-) Transcript_42904:1354-1761(-)